MATELRRRTPEELLLEVQAEEAAETGGQLKVFLGYASGVGKSFRMLDEARRRLERGQNIVVAAVQSNLPPEAAAILAKLPLAPPKTINGRSVIDVDALLRLRPAVCVIDGLAYDNPPGLRNRTRWEDADELLRAGISVIASINIQYVDELRDQVEAITLKHVFETVPVSFIRRADEIEVVDASPEEPLAPTPEAQSDFARRQQRLSKLRELALLLAADVVDQQLSNYLKCHGIEQNLGAQERILVCITPRANATEMIETGATIAEKFHGDLTVAYVSQPEISAADQAALDKKLEYSRARGARIEVLEGEDPVEAILDFARRRGITQLFIGHSQRSGVWSRVWGNPVEKIIRRSRGMDVRIFPQ